MIAEIALERLKRGSSPEDVGVGGELLEDVLKARQSKG